jgi:hypothetical protein
MVIIQNRRNVPALYNCTNKDQSDPNIVAKISLIDLTRDDAKKIKTSFFLICRNREK